MQNPVPQRLNSFQVSSGTELPVAIPYPSSGLPLGGSLLEDKTPLRFTAAMGDYVPRAPASDEAKKYNENLPGMGRVYNYSNNRYPKDAFEEIISMLQQPEFEIGDTTRIVEEITNAGVADTGGLFE
jgi:hypothetical protein